MAITRTELSGHTQFGLSAYIVDEESDIDDLPVDIPMGSTAVVIDTGNLYILKSNGEWKAV